MNKSWKITGYLATIIIVLAFPGYLIKAVWFDGYGQSNSQYSEPQFVGSKTCLECHNIEYEQWLISDHYFAMDTADEQSVFGDFNNAILEQGGRTHKFYKKDKKFFVFTDGPEGKMEEFEVKYTFGAWPLQQYLVPFPDGKYQTLALTWDTITKQWYHMADRVYEGQDIDHNNWLHWTNQAQNWNGMCADCHSTNLKKGFDHKTKTYNTTWSEISVGCEACHGPSSEHLKWAQLPALARPQNTNTGLPVQTSEITNFKYVDLCTRCHSRRGVLSDFDHNFAEIMDYIIPTLAVEPNYYIDGQILEEDYVYGSFVQSKMYMNDVKCNDCHNVHSGKLVLQGNDLCLQCHRSDIYDTYNHHFHKNAGENGDPVVSQFGDTYNVGDGASCINCHMPGRYYMGVDYRRDHSFRIPRPDLSEELDTPNACTYCHSDKTNNWAAGYMEQWYGKNLRSNYGALIASQLNNSEAGFEKLSEVIADDLFPPHIRSTAMANVIQLDALSSHQLLEDKFSDLEPSIRHTALLHYELYSLEDIPKILPLLNDPVKAVRIEAAMKLSGVPKDQIPEQAGRSLEEAQTEYRTAMEYTADFAAGRHNLGNFYTNLGDTQKAIENYIEALRIDIEFYPAKVNLAMAYNRIQQNDKAELLLKDVVENHPEVVGTKYSLGLLLAEMEKYDEATYYLQLAAEEQPDNPRVFLNLGQLLDFDNQVAEAENALLTALSLDPENPDIMTALIDFYIKHKRFNEAKKLALKYQETYPDDTSIKDYLKYIDGQVQ